MIGFLVKDVHMNKMVKTKIRYILLNVGHVGHFRTPKIHGNPSDHGGTLDGSRYFVHIFKVIFIQTNPLKQVHIVDTSVSKLSMVEGLVLLHLLSGADGDVIAVRSLRNVIMYKITARPRRPV
jgi:hypothetical protein